MFIPFLLYLFIFNPNTPPSAGNPLYITLELNGAPLMGSGRYKEGILNWCPHMGHTGHTGHTGHMGHMGHAAHVTAPPFHFSLVLFHPLICTFLFYLNTFSSSSQPHLWLDVRRTGVAAKGCEVAQRLALLLQAHDGVLLEHRGRHLLPDQHPLPPHGLQHERCEILRMADESGTVLR